MLAESLSYVCPRSTIRSLPHTLLLHSRSLCFTTESYHFFHHDYLQTFKCSHSVAGQLTEAVQYATPSPPFTDATGPNSPHSQSAGLNPPYFKCALLAFGLRFAHEPATVIRLIRVDSESLICWLSHPMCKLHDM